MYTERTRQQNMHIITIIVISTTCLLTQWAS